jgi:hypothetical protein
MPFFLWWRAPQQMLRTHRSLEAYCSNPWWRRLILFVFSFNGALMEWKWEGKPELLEEKPVSVSLCPPQIPHGLSRDWNRASEVRDWRLTAYPLVSEAGPTLQAAFLVFNTRARCLAHPVLFPSEHTLPSCGSKYCVSETTRSLTGFIQISSLRITFI